MQITPCKSLRITIISVEMTNFNYFGYQSRIEITNFNFGLGSGRSLLRANASCSSSSSSSYTGSSSVHPSLREILRSLGRRVDVTSGTPVCVVDGRPATNVSIRQHTSAYVSIRQHTSAYVSIRQHTLMAGLPQILTLSYFSLSSCVCV
jgi:hypothetical protein